MRKSQSPIAAVERYRERLNGVDGIQLNCVQNDVKSNYAYFPVVFEEKLFGASRTEVFDKLAENGIGARKYFYPLTNTFECFHGKYDVTKTPVALHISKRVLTLPFLCMFHQTYALHHAAFASRVTL